MLPLNINVKAKFGCSYVLSLFIDDQQMNANACKSAYAERTPINTCVIKLLFKVLRSSPVVLLVSHCIQLCASSKPLRIIPSSQKCMETYGILQKNLQAKSLSSYTVSIGIPRKLKKMIRL